MSSLDIRDRKAESAQADKAHGFWAYCHFIQKLSSIQRDNFDLAYDDYSLQITLGPEQQLSLVQITVARARVRLLRAGDIIA